MYRLFNYNRNKGKKFNMEKILSIKSFFLIIALILAVIVTLISLFMKSKNVNKYSGVNPENLRAMTYEEVSDEDEKVEGTDNVKFSAFFLRDLDSDGYAEKLKGTCKEIGTSDTLYISLNVLSDGVLKNGKIEFINNNYIFNTALMSDDVIDGTYINTDTTSINLKNVQNGTQKLIIGKIKAGDYRYSSKTFEKITNVNKYNDINKVILTGEFESYSGETVNIRKEVELNVDWYGSVKAEIPSSYIKNKQNKYQNYNLNGIKDEAKGVVKIKFKVVTQEVNNKLLLFRNVTTGVIPELNGYKPVSVNISNTDVNFSFDENTGEFCIIKQAELDTTGIIAKKAYTGEYSTNRYNEYSMMVEYPIEAIEEMASSIKILIPVETYYEGFNNTNIEFENPYISNIAKETLTINYNYSSGNIINCNIEAGEYVPSPYNEWTISKNNTLGIYNSNDNDEYDEYLVRWYFSRGEEGNISKIIANEAEDCYGDYFIKTDNSLVPLGEICETVGIYWDTPEAMLGTDGYINLINADNNEVIHQFTTADWNNYSKENPYALPSNNIHLKIETSKTINNSSFSLYQIKRIDSNKIFDQYTLEEFDTLEKVKTSINVKCSYTEDGSLEHLTNKYATPTYSKPISIATLDKVSKQYMSTQETSNNVEIVINAYSGKYNMTGWSNGIYLIKLPAEIAVIKINSVVSSNSDVSILGYDFYEKDGYSFIKIYTGNDEPTGYSIKVDCDVTPDSRELTQKREVELYAYNECCNNYKKGFKAQDIYDLNENGKINDYIDYNKKEVQLIGPSTLLTSEVGIEYDEIGSEVVAPQVAIVDKSTFEKNAKVLIQLKNNYTGKISSVKLFGTVPYEGNTFKINSHVNLNSTFSTKLMGPIEVPERYKDIVKIYYTENENPTIDLLDNSNGWMLEPENYSNIKNYIIDFNEGELETGEQIEFYYTINIPAGIDYNKIAYSTHMIKFALETDEGKLLQETETAKLGFMIAKKYNVEINKTKKGSSTPVKNAMYEVMDSETGESKYMVTNNEGKAIFNGLYVDKEYIIKEIKAPIDYVINEQELRIKANVVDDELIINKISGETLNNITVENRENLGHTVLISLDNEPKYTLRLNKKEETTGEPIDGIKYKLEGKGIPNSGRILTTYHGGTANFSGLYVGEEYTLTEIYAKGYDYSSNPIRFKANWDIENNIQFDVLEGEANNVQIINENTLQNIISIDLQNRKLKEYKLNLIKNEENTDVVIKDAEFNIQGTWLNENYTTDEEGKFLSETLYEGIEYTLKEIYSPDGYSLSNNEIKFVGNFDDTNNLSVNITKGDLATDENSLWNCENIFIDGNKAESKKAEIVTENNNNIFKLGFENEVMFKLTKIDGESHELIPNAKFTIKKINIDRNGNRTETDAVDVNENIVGEDEEINGVSYKIIKTNEKGEIVENLPSGYYKIVEIESAEGYVLDNNEEDRTYYFGIDQGKAAEVDLSNVEINLYDEENGVVEFVDVAPTNNNGYIKIGYCNGRITIPAYKTVSGEKIFIKDSSKNEAIIVKYNYEDKVEWAFCITSNINSKVYRIIKLQNNNYMVVGQIGQAKINGEKTATGEEIDLTRGTHNNEQAVYFIINEEGKVVEAKRYTTNLTTGSSYLKNVLEVDDGYVFSGMTKTDMLFNSTETVSGEEILLTTNSSTVFQPFIIKTDKFGNIKETFIMNSDNESRISEMVISNENTGYVFVGQIAKGNLVISEEYSNNNESYEINPASAHAYIAKVSENLKLEWINISEGGGNNSFNGICNNGSCYVAVGQSTGAYYISGENTVDGNSISGTSGAHGLFAVYNNEGKAEKFICYI